MNTDSSVTYIGWYVDDITVYTCDSVVAPPPPPPPPATSAATAVKVKGGLRKATVSWQPPTTSPGLVTGYRVATGDTGKTVAGSERQATLGALTPGKSYVFTVTPVLTGAVFGPSTSVTAKATKATLRVDKASGKTVLSGKLSAGKTGLKAKILKVLVEKKAKWVKLGKVKTGKGGKFTLRLSGTSPRTFRVRFAGALGLMGVESPKRRL